jgi:predicted RNase H-like nuclease
MHECHHIGCKRKYKTEIGLKKHNESEIHKQLVIIDKPKIVPNKVNDKPKITTIYKCPNYGCNRKYKTEINLKKHIESGTHHKLVIIDKPKIVPNKVNDKPKITAIYKCPHDGHAIDMSNSSSSDEEEDDSWSMTISI